MKKRVTSVKRKPKAKATRKAAPAATTRGVRAAVLHEPHFLLHRGIGDLNLTASAKAAAEQLLKAHPEVIFTSGRRDVNQQASAMAGNVVKNRKWIEQTYVPSDERTQLQTWVDTHPAAVSAADIAAGLAGIMNAWTDAQRANISRHFSGQAFDVQPVAGEAGAAIKATIQKLPKLRKFLDKEGGLIIWHADFE
jgi:hypothetical protein